MLTDRNGMEVLDGPRCRELLAGGTIGRVGLSVGALPAVLPVTFALLDDDIIFRSTPGSKLLAAAAGQVVCFEVDSIDVERKEAWSVLVTGRAEVIADPVLLERARSLPIEPWIAIPAGPFVRIRTELISGRRLAAAAVRASA